MSTYSNKGKKEPLSFTVHVNTQPKTTSRLLHQSTRLMLIHASWSIFFNPCKQRKQVKLAIRGKKLPLNLQTLVQQKNKSNWTYQETLNYWVSTIWSSLPSINTKHCIPAFKMSIVEAWLVRVKNRYSKLKWIKWTYEGENKTKMEGKKTEKQKFRLKNHTRHHHAFSWAHLVIYCKYVLSSRSAGVAHSFLLMEQSLILDVLLVSLIHQKKG